MRGNLKSIRRITILESPINFYFNERLKGKKDYLEKQDGSCTDKTSYCSVSFVYNLFSFPGYGETCLNKEVICIILAKPLHGNE